jgi:prepilin-type N-terminal cleavage/methylation domain-containing protein
MRTPTLRSRRGVTLIEMMIALLLFVAVFGMAVPFFRYQARSVSQSSGRQDALQNARYAQNAIDRDLRIAGIGVVNNQPLLVQADMYAITFNADLTTSDSADPTSIYYDPTVDSTATISMNNGTKVQLPLSPKFYPDSNYFNGAIPSRAETISYWVSLDSASGRSDQYILFRRVNADNPRIVAKGIIIPTGVSFFTYMRPDSTGNLDSIRTTSLPIIHVPLHGSPQDTGHLAWLDSIRVVKILSQGLYHDPDKGDIIRKVASSTKLINSGMVRSTMCGDVPLPATAAVATPMPNPLAPTSVHITWSASIDQDNGEKDVERYMVFKRLVGDPDWGEPIASVAASPATYAIDDTDLHTGNWEYAVLAQDCSPANSSSDGAGTVAIP